MPRAARANIGRRTSRANVLYNYRQRQTETERHERLEVERIRSAQNRMLNSRIVVGLRSVFDYHAEYDYANVKQIHIGEMSKVCPYCNAKKWHDETPGLCCASGKVFPERIEEPPEFIKNLILEEHPLSSDFLNNCRQYNTLFQMTSFGAKEIKEGNFMPTFKIQGQIYHLIGSLLPNPEVTPRFLQIYFMSESDQILTRSNINPTLKRELIEKLQQLLQDNNNLIRSFKYNLESTPTQQLNNLKLIIHADRIPVGEHRGRYNAPTVNEVAALLVDEDKGPRDIILHGRDGRLQRVSELHRSYDPLQYPLMFIRGEDGYHINIKQHNNQAKTVSCMQFYAYRFMIRENSLNHLHFYRNLFNQYSVDMMAKMISERLNFIRNNKKKLRAEDYVHLRDAVNEDGNIRAADLGQRVILPSTFTGSPRYMHEKTQDALTYVRRKGRPDLFITFTCNPDWIEIKNELKGSQKSFDRHDIISRVFHLKLKKLMDLLIKHSIFGKVECYIYSVEWQKRGLPHCHILLWLEIKIQPDEIDRIISAELPNPNIDPLLFDIVCKSMIHGPCGEFNMTSPCMNNGKCSKKYPRNFVQKTQTGNDGYPTYRRRSPENGGYCTSLNIRGKMVQIDNRWVVPYCPVLSRCFDAHINVEYCHSVQAIKYICKYVNKGSDQATFSIQNNDEICNYINGRYICSSEAFWRFFDFSIHERFPAVIHLAVHLENNQRVYFTEDNIYEVIDNPRKTTLTAFFELCSSDAFARTLLYHEVPAYYTWSNNKFSRRKRGQDVQGYPGFKKDSALGRVYTIHPNQSECFHLRMLLHHVRGPTSFECLKTVNGTVHPTFKAACSALGLLESDNHWKNTLSDAAISKSASKMRDLFAVILVFCQPSEPMILWETYRKDFCEDILHRERNRSNNFELTFSEEIFNRGLIEIEDKVVHLSEKYLNEFGLTSPVRENQTSNDPYDSLFRRPDDIQQLNNFLEVNMPRLVDDQRYAFNVIIESVTNNQGKVFFLDAPGGTGKTFLLNLLLAKVKSTGSTALAVASSGIAATLLSGGRTAHSTFKLPLNVFCDGESICPIRKNGRLGKIIQGTSLIVWDECTMIHRAHIEAVDRTLQDLRSNNKMMGGITFVFAGDFRQTLPVIPRGTRPDTIKACLKSSSIWNSIEQLNLRTNMRAYLAEGDPEFPGQLLKIGDGTEDSDNGYITLSEKIGNIVTTVDDLISRIYPDVSNLMNKPYHWLCERAIISPRNVTAEEINNIILEKVNGDSQDYLSIDTVVSSDDAIHYPQEFLNSLCPSGLPSHRLTLNIGCPIMLLRNLQPPNLCNGTRLKIIAMRENIIEALILTGPAAGEIAFIPRIPMIPTDLPFQFKRLQFPIKVSFAITINKSQGQTYKYVGVDLRSECFSHGHLYVGLSRTGDPNNQFILITEGNKTRNIIYPEVL